MRNNSNSQQFSLNAERTLELGLPIILEKKRVKSPIQNEEEAKVEEEIEVKPKMTQEEIDNKIKERAYLARRRLRQ